MLEFFANVLGEEKGLGLVWLGAAGIFIFPIGILILRLVKLPLDSWFSPRASEIYHRIIDPYKNWFVTIAIIAILDLAWIAIVTSKYRAIVEIPLSLSLAILASWLGSRVVKQFFEIYLLDKTLKSGRKANSELLLITKLLANLGVITIAVVIFAQTHQINILGVVASLGVGGLAVAFAAQKTLEQVLGGIVLYLDKPFVVDDYIGLPDGTFGRVESIGLRSTKIRLTGKGTLAIVPNTTLTRTIIENFTGGKKIISLIYLNFARVIPAEDRALIRQVIIESTSDIFGIDSRSTNVVFKDRYHNFHETKTQVQVTFFILGSGEVSMELRRQVLDLANQNITETLREYGISFEIEEPTIYIDAPITI